jgi:hypothetical protein
MAIRDGLKELPSNLYRDYFVSKDFYTFLPVMAGLQFLKGYIKIHEFMQGAILN